MSCTLGYPGSTDLTQSQFLWPLDPASLNILESSTHPPSEIVHLFSFRNSLLSFAERVIQEFHKPKNLRGGVASVPIKNPPASSTTSTTSTYNNTYRSTFISKKESYSPSPCRFSKPQSHSGTSPPVRRKSLKPPRPRFSSPLSPNLPGTILKGYEERRPIPSTRKKEEVLYRAVLEKAIETNSGRPFFRVAKLKTNSINPQSFGDQYRDGRNQAKMMSRFNHVDSNQCGGLSDSWVIVPPDMSWDIVKRDDIII